MRPSAIIVGSVLSLAWGASVQGGMILLSSENHVFGSNDTSSYDISAPHEIHGGAGPISSAGINAYSDAGGGAAVEWTQTYGPAVEAHATSTIVFRSPDPAEYLLMVKGGLYGTVDAVSFTFIDLTTGTVLAQETRSHTDPTVNPRFDQWQEFVPFEEFIPFDPDDLLQVTLSVDGHRSGPGFPDPLIYQEGYITVQTSPLVPEPATLTLLVLGLAGAGWSRRLARSRK